MKADLHIHTKASDGSMEPEKVVEWAYFKNLDVMAVTDHDTVSGLDSAKNKADELGIKFVAGIEFSTFLDYEIHILGYNFDYHNVEFLAELENVKNMRKNRNVQIGKRLEELGINLGIDFNEDGLGRMNIARLMVKQNYANTVSNAFDNYLGVSGKAYIKSERLTPIEAVKLIKKYGGVASIAHPKKYFLNGTLESLIESLMPFGLDGIEINYPTHTKSDKAELSQIAQKFALIETGGSDFHGDEDKNYCFEPNQATINTLHIWISVDFN